MNKRESLTVRRGDKLHYCTLAKTLQRNGIVVVVINYTLYPKVFFLLLEIFLMYLLFSFTLFFLFLSFFFSLFFFFLIFSFFLFLKGLVADMQRDITAAITWTKWNIKLHGGDPDNVTSTHLSSPLISSLYFNIFSDLFCGPQRWCTIGSFSNFTKCSRE